MGGALPVKIVNVTIVVIILSIVKLLLRGGTRDELPWGRREREYQKQDPLGGNYVPIPCPH